jgi:hypothetical protein
MLEKACLFIKEKRRETFFPFPSFLYFTYQLTEYFRQLTDYGFD